MAREAQSPIGRAASDVSDLLQGLGVTCAVCGSRDLAVRVAFTVERPGQLGTVCETVGTCAAHSNALTTASLARKLRLAYIGERKAATRAPA